MLANHRLQLTGCARDMMMLLLSLSIWCSLSASGRQLSLLRSPANEVETNELRSVPQVGRFDSHG